RAGREGRAERRVPRRLLLYRAIHVHRARAHASRLLTRSEASTPPREQARDREGGASPGNRGVFGHWASKRAIIEALAGDAFPGDAYAAGARRSVFLCALALAGDFIANRRLGALGEARANSPAHRRALAYDALIPFGACVAVVAGGSFFHHPTDTVLCGA